jgi:hypothetical protein
MYSTSFELFTKLNLNYFTTVVLNCEMYNTLRTINPHSSHSVHIFIRIEMTNKKQYTVHVVGLEIKPAWQDCKHGQES